MQRYRFLKTIYQTTKEGKIEEVGKKTIIKYKCLICGYEHEWDNAYDDEKKEEVQSEVDKHYNEHIIPDEPTLSE
jgi:ribosomal protein L44E